jgi:hypothetical protein
MYLIISPLSKYLIAISIGFRQLLETFEINWNAYTLKMFKFFHTHGLWLLRFLFMLATFIDVLVVELLHKFRLKRLVHGEFWYLLLIFTDIVHFL